MLHVTRVQSMPMSIIAIDETAGDGSSHLYIILFIC